MEGWVKSGDASCKGGRESRRLTSPGTDVCREVGDVISSIPPVVVAPVAGAGVTCRIPIREGVFLVRIDSSVKVMRWLVGKVSINTDLVENWRGKIPFVVHLHLAPGHLRTVLFYAAPDAIIVEITECLVRMPRGPWRLPPAHGRLRRAG